MLTEVLMLLNFLEIIKNQLRFPFLHFFHVPLHSIKWQFGFFFSSGCQIRVFQWVVMVDQGWFPRPAGLHLL